MKRLLLCSTFLLCFVGLWAQRNVVIKVGVCPAGATLDANKYVKGEALSHFWNKATTESSALQPLSATNNTLVDSVLIVGGGYEKLTFSVSTIDASGPPTPQILHHSPDSLVVGFQTDIEPLGENVFTVSTSFFKDSVNLVPRYVNGYYSAKIVNPKKIIELGIRYYNACNVKSTNVYMPLSSTSKMLLDSLVYNVSGFGGLPSYKTIELIIDSIHTPTSIANGTPQTIPDLSSTYLDTLGRFTKNTTVQIKVNLASGGYILSDTAVFWVNQLAYKIDSVKSSLPYRVCLSNTSKKILEPISWNLSGGKLVFGTDRDNIIKVEYKKPGFYDIKMLGIYDNGIDTEDSLLVKDAIIVPGIFSRGKNDTLAVCEGAAVLLHGYGVTTWRDSIYPINTSNTETWTISPTRSKWYYADVSDSYTNSKYIDSVYVLVVKKLVNPVFESETVCAREKTAKLRLDKVDSLWIYNNGVFSEAYTASKPYYLSSNYEGSIKYSIKGCSWNSSAQFHKNIIDSILAYNVNPTQICKGTSQIISLSSSTIPSFYRWKKGSVLLSDSSTVKLSEAGNYLVEYGKAEQCVQTKLFAITYISALHDAITSINYLPGIGYISTYSKSGDQMSSHYANKLFSREYNGRSDTISRIFGMNASFSFDKTHLLVDTLQYRAENYALPLKYTVTNIDMTLGGNCPSSIVSITSGSPIRLLARETTDGTMSLSWSDYTVSPNESFYIFRGTSLEDMQVLTVVSPTVFNLSDTKPLKNGMYAIGVVDKFGGYELYGSMQYKWQQGFITSNISPMADGFKRIGVIAAYQTTSQGNSVYLRAAAPFSDSVKWKVQNDTLGYTRGKDSVFNITYNKAGKYDVQLTVYRNGKADSVTLNDYLTVLEVPIHFLLDTIYAKSDDTVKISLTDYLKVDAKLPYIDAYFDYNAFTNSKMIHTSSYSNQTGKSTDTLRFQNIKSDTTFVLPVNLNSSQKDTLYITVSSKQNTAPKIANNIPMQIANMGWQFAAFNVNQYVSDDYTFPNNLQYQFVQNPVLMGTIENGILRVRQTDLDWVGETTVKIKITDASGLFDTMKVKYLQPSLMKIPSKRPLVSFRANKTLIMLGDSVSFFPDIKGADSVLWTFVGGDTLQSRAINPTVQYLRPGKYAVTLKAMNYHGDSVFTRTSYIDVWSTIQPRDTVVCAGKTVNFSVVGSFKSYKWSTDETNSTISVAPQATTTYRVTLTVNKFVKVYDSVVVKVPLAANLGRDTAICKGSIFVLNPGKFKSYFWNGSSVAGLASMPVTEAKEFTVKTIDDLGCETTDAITVAINDLPAIELGPDTTFCWKKIKTISAPSNLKYKWNNKATSQSISTDTTGTWKVTITDSKGCQNTDSLKTIARIPFNEQIGIVTQTESMYGGLVRNLIAWEPTPNKDIDKYIVYRKEISSYTLVDSIKKDSLTIVIDKSTDPRVQSETYALRTRDVCGNLSDFSNPHSSMYLACFIKRGTTDSSVQVEWSQYHGIAVSDYIIYRARKGSALAPIDTIKNTGSETMVWSDTKSIGINATYRIGFDINKLTPSKLKSDTGPFSQSLSNMSEVSLVEQTDIANNSHLGAYPNPSNGTFTVKFDNMHGVTILKIEDLLGRLYLQRSVNSQGAINETVSLQGLAKGLYIVKIETNNQVQTQLIEIQ